MSCLPLLFGAGIATIAYGEEVSTEEWNIAADKVVKYDNPSSIVAQGNVVLIKKKKLPPAPRKTPPALSSWSELLEEPQTDTVVLADEIDKQPPPTFKTTVTIKADWMVYDLELKTIKAKGNLRITSGDDLLTAKEGVLKLSDQTGKFTDATIVRKENDLHLEGKTIEKTGFDTYTIADGWVITCKLEDGETPPWSIASSKTDIQPGGYAVLKHARFNIKNVPVFYLPWMIVPIKNTRQTGFLFPEVSSSSNNGFGVNLPFFINVSESTDVTLFPEYYHNRGFMPGIEARYAGAGTDKGVFTASYLHDELSDPSETEYYSDTGFTHDNQDRYWIRGKADNTIGGWQSRLDIDIVSDEDYLTEFDSGVTGYDSSQDQYLDTFGRGFQNQTATERENSFEIQNSWGGISLVGSLLAINDASTEASDSDTPLWKLPEFDFTGALPVASTNLTFDWDANYVNYWREDGVGGHRVDLRPALASSLPMGPYLEARAEAAVRETFYVVQTYGDGEWSNDDTQNRLMPEFEAEVATTLEREFGFGGNSRGLSHQIRPYVKYEYIGDVNQDDLPYFDSVDSIDDSNQITYGMDNFFDTILHNTSGNSRSTYGTLQIEQSYDLRSSASDEPFSDIYAKLTWKPMATSAVSYKAYYDVYDNDFNSHTLETTINDSRGDSFSLDYSKKIADDIEQINATFHAKLINGWSVEGEVEHSIYSDETNTANGSLIYQALCWSVQFETRYTPTDTTYLVLFNLANLGVPFGVSM